MGALAPPRAWLADKSQTKPQLEKVSNSDEKSLVVTAFKKSFKNAAKVSVLSVERVENIAMWQVGCAIYLHGILFLLYVFCDGYQFDDDASHLRAWPCGRATQSRLRR